MHEISQLFISKIGIMKVEYITKKISENRQDSFWYWGEDVAFVDLDNGNRLLVGTSGDVEYIEKGVKYKNEDAVNLLISNEYQYNDLDLDDLYMSGDIPNNNHFTVVEMDEYGVIVGDCLGVCHDYDEAIEMLKELAFINEG